MTTMKAAVVPELGAKLEIRELAVPTPGPGQVLVKMEASGLCHTDIHAAYGDWPVKPNPPFIPGHEGVGIVTESGPGATLHKPGDRVAIAWLGYACGHCDHCVAGWETLCLSQQNSGYSIDGSYAEYAVADDRYVVSVPDGVSSFDAAPLTCAGVTTFKAIKVAGLQPGETASIIGIGGLGHLALQYAHVLGAREAGPGQRARRGLHGQRQDDRPGKSGLRIRRRGRRGRHGGLTANVRAGLRVAAARRPAGVRGTAGR
jgi:propanol-preferring alcohol dehydrogenase